MIFSFLTSKGDGHDEADLELQFDGTPINAGDVADLTVTVVSAEVEPAASIDQFPSWSNFEKLTRITPGKPGGCP